MLNISRMRILFVNTSEHAGGAAIAAHRLMKALNRNHVKAQMLVRDRETTSPDVVTVRCKWLAKLKFLAERIGVLWANRFHTDRLFAVDPAFLGNDITRHPAFRKADIIHLHWVNQGMLSMSGLRKILRSGKPVVWTMHDMWPATGICHQADTCDGWQQGCGFCPLLWKGGRMNDLSHRTYQRKKQVFGEGSSIRFVACSNWLADIARQSPLLARNTVVCIPNPIDSRFFAPGDRSEARSRLGLPLDKYILLFVAYKATDKNKGIDYLREAVDIVCHRKPVLKEQLCVVPVGHEADTLKNSFACEACPQNYVSDEEVMRDLYHAADLLLMPTLMDNLPNTIVEAMACGIPCVGFRVGGLPQMINHGKNGYLADFRNAEDLAEGILQTLFTYSHTELSTAARRSAVCNYSEDAVAERYIDLYEEALDANQQNKG